MMRSERAKFLFGETVRTFRKWRYYGLLLMLSVAFGSVMMLVMLDLFSREMSMVDAQFVQPERIIRYAWCDSAFDAAFDALDDDGIAAKSQFYTRDEWVMSPAESRMLRVSHVTMRIWRWRGRTWWRTRWRWMRRTCPCLRCRRGTR